MIAPMVMQLQIRYFDSYLPYLSFRSFSKIKQHDCVAAAAEATSHYLFSFIVFETLTIPAETVAVVATESQFEIAYGSFYKTLLFQASNLASAAAAGLSEEWGLSLQQPIPPAATIH